MQHRRIRNVVWELISSAFAVRVCSVGLFIIRYLRIVDLHVKIALLTLFPGVTSVDHLLNRLLESRICV